MELAEAIQVWHQPHNRQVALTAVKNDPVLAEAVRAEMMRLKAIDGARERDDKPGCVITRNRLRCCEALLAVVPKPEEKKT
jgi:hypothetical protein